MAVRLTVFRNVTPCSLIVSNLFEERVTFVLLSLSAGQKFTSNIEWNFFSKCRQLSDKVHGVTSRYLWYVPSVTFPWTYSLGVYKWGASPARHLEESNHMLKQDEILVLPSLGTRTEVTTFANENEGRQYNPERAILCRHVVFLGEIWLDTSCCSMGFRNKRIPYSILIVVFLKSYYPPR